MDEQTSSEMELFNDVTAEDISVMTEGEGEAKPSEPENQGEETENNGNAAKEQKQAQKPEQEVESFTLKHLGKEVKLNREELMAAAQKGLDYDRIRPLYDGARPVYNKISALAQKAGQDVDSFLSGLDRQAYDIQINQRTNELLESGEYSESAARKMAEMEYKINKSQKEDEQRQATESKNQALKQSVGSFIMNNPEFLKEFPNAQLPSDMVESLNGGMNIEGAWAKHQLAKEREANEEMKRQLQAYQQKETNQKSAAPKLKGDLESMADDPFLQGLLGD